MICYTCTRSTLLALARWPTAVRNGSLAKARLTPRCLDSRLFSTACGLRLDVEAAGNVKPFGTNKLPETRSEAKPGIDRPAWQLEKEASKRKLNGAAWNPRKKLSPDTMEGIRHLHTTQPHRFTTPVLAQHFKVSPEAIQRILKSKWRPTDEEQEDRLRRWDKRGEHIWRNLVELGVKPPKRWREMGVGRAKSGQKPSWKSKSRNQVTVHDSASEAFGWHEEDLIPIVDGKSSASPSRRSNLPFSARIGV